MIRKRNKVNHPTHVTLPLIMAYIYIYKMGEIFGHDLMPLYCADSFISVLHLNFKNALDFKASLKEKKSKENPLITACVVF